MGVTPALQKQRWEQSRLGSLAAIRKDEKGHPRCLSNTTGTCYYETSG